MIILFVYNTFFRSLREIPFHLLDLSFSNRTYPQTQSGLRPSTDPANDKGIKEDLLRSPVCHPFASASSMSLWLQHIESILNATKHPKDRKFVLHDFTSKILRLITPRLPLGVKTLPRFMATSNTTIINPIQKILEKGYARYQYLRGEPWHAYDHSQQQEPPPVKILVLGGSVTMGINCYLPSIKISSGECAWTRRLEILVNQFFAPPGMTIPRRLIRVTTVASGGTNTRVGQTILSDDLLPEKARNPDIIINAYLTNDMHWNTMQEIKQQNVTHMEGIFDMAQEFTRFVLQSSCYPPLLLWLDDYLGNEQREIATLLEPTQVLSVLSSYYGFGVFSYADMVRDMVYKDTTIGVFSPAGWYNKHKKGVMKREIHPGGAMHMATSLLVAYYMLTLATTFCSLESWIAPADPIINTMILSEEHHGRTRSVTGLSLKETPEQARWDLEPYVAPLGLPPPITKDLSLETISEEWKEAENLRIKHCVGAAYQSSASMERKRCPFGWIAGLGEYNETSTIKDLFLQYFANRTYPEDWDLVDDTGGKGKIGWIPIHVKSMNSISNAGAGNSPMVLDFPFGGPPITTVSLYILKSYGEKWKDSSAQVVVYSLDNRTHELARHTMVGYHAKNTSETYAEKVHLSRNLNVSRLRLEISLVNGTTFKLQGLALCSD